MKSQYKIVISGRVQGVGFRYAARDQARNLNLNGWVENLPDGSVLSVINGLEDSCVNFINWCRSGTGYSWVENVKITKMEPELLKSFVIKH